MKMKQHRVLVIHREPESAGTLALMCDILECFATTATSSKEALELVQQIKFDLIILDYDLNPGDGLDLIRKVRELKIEIPVIFLTIDQELAGSLQNSPLHISRVMIKPLTLQGLGKILDEVLS